MGAKNRGRGRITDFKLQVVRRKNLYVSQFFAQSLPDYTRSKLCLLKKLNQRQKVGRGDKT